MRWWIVYDPKWFGLNPAPIMVLEILVSLAAVGVAAHVLASFDVFFGALNLTFFLLAFIHACVELGVYYANSLRPWYMLFRSAVQFLCWAVLLAFNAIGPTALFDSCKDCYSGLVELLYVMLVFTFLETVLTISMLVVAAVAARRKRRGQRESRAPSWSVDEHDGRRWTLGLG